MIQRLALQYNKAIAYILFFSFYISCVSPLYAAAKMQYPPIGDLDRYLSYNNYGPAIGPNNASVLDKENALTVPPVTAAGDNILSLSSPEINAGESADFIGGPSQPEMSAFKSAGTNDMVNLFTGDFSYNIPLLDVGGYPVNIFYNGGITMEQEASWVGLGWNINPGTVSRNMRGVPDDFDGTEKITQEQNMKPNITWGGRFGVDVEIAGVKGLGVGLGLGYSHNSYLGPALDVGVKASYSYQLADFAASEKNNKTSKDTAGIGELSLNVGVSADLNSRNGLTINPNISLGSRFNSNGNVAGLGWGVSTSYNSRTGIKGLNLYEQGSFSYNDARRPFSNTLRSTSISFAKPSYIPTMRMPVTNSAFAGSFQYGGSIFGMEGTLEIEVYKQESSVESEDREQTKPMVGYIYAQNAAGNPDAIMDYTRFNDKEVTPKTSIISVPQYAYDVFSISGEGTGGSIRAYRNDLGYVRDNRIKSKDKSFSFGADFAPPGQVGANFNTVNTPTTSGDWDQGNHLRASIPFREKTKLDEHVYFRNPGETSVLNDNQYQHIGGTDIVRFKLGNSTSNPEVLPVLERFNQEGKKIGEQNVINTTPSDRVKRTQVISFLTADETAEIGLEPVIRNYTPATANTLLNADTLPYSTILRTDPLKRRGHHISEINVLESDGKKYIYGLPVYNLKQEDYTVTVESTPDYENDLVQISTDEMNVYQPFMTNSKKDGYKLITKTPAYAHSFLLTGLISPDYVDVTGNGITEDDLGTAVKFNYTKMAHDYKWRTPYNTPIAALAHFNDGNLSETRDDKGIVTYGEREAWYMHSIESKTMIALFTVEDRQDAKGVLGIMNGINSAEGANKRLKQIDLYNKADLRKNGKANAKPVKTVHFEYDYSLCADVPDNTGGVEPLTGPNKNLAKGKLTLKGIYFTYNGQARAHKNRYVFEYGSAPAYQKNASDRWGNYKPRSQNPESLKNSIYPYSLQTEATANTNAAAWNLSKILLPSGGQLEVEYESDDYAYVQDRRATRMMSLAYMTYDTTQNKGNYLYDLNDRGKLTDHDIVYINVPDICYSKQEVFNKYLQGINQLAFKLAVNMPNKKEYITMYANIKNYGFVSNENKIWIQLHMVDGYSPLTLTSLDYMREHLPAQAYVGYAPEGATGWEEFAQALEGLVEGLKGAFKSPIKFLMGEKKAQTIVLAESFVRLNVPDYKKYGGGHRVKAIRIKDNWEAMTQQYTSVYGQKYDYTKTEIVDGEPKVISSGVASYEPSIGGEENPFQEILRISNRLPLGPANYEAIEMPVMDAFFPAPVVGYSKVTVSSVKSATPAAHGVKSRSGTGKQVTEFYTARDFPVSWDYTRIDPSSDKKQHVPSSFAFFKSYAFDSRAISQGFRVQLNDMHGKIKSQSSYAETDLNSRISYTEYRYRNTGGKGLNEQFDFVHQKTGGEIKPGNMGVDIELMTDTREFTVKSKSTSLQGQMDWFPFAIFQIWLPFIWPTFSKSENNYRAVTTTKVINYHSIVDSVIAIEKGSAVATKNLLYDAETGNTILTRTNNEFDRPVYQTTYPAYWAYSGMGPAYKNIDARIAGVSFLDGKISGLTNQEIQTFFESGDEIYIKAGSLASACDGIKLSDASVKRIWVMDKNKDYSSLTNPNPDFIFIDANGIPYTRSNVTMRIVRSGKRNILSAQLQNFVSLSTPDSVVGGKRVLVFESVKDKNVLNSSAMEYKEKWQTDKDVIKRLKMIPQPDITQGANLIVNGDFSAGYTGFSSNYVVGNNPGTYQIKPAVNGCVDHTTGTGNMMVVDGSTTPASTTTTPATWTVWAQTVTVVPNRVYSFSMWAQAVYHNNPSLLRVYINNVEFTQLQLTTTCAWLNASKYWNSLTATSAYIRIICVGTSSSGNDFALDDISFNSLAQPSCDVNELPDCTGYLEKQINPYRKGLLGTFRSHRSMLFYGERVQGQNAIETPTAIDKDGTLAGFLPYWNFNVNNNLTPVVSPKWVWNSEITRVNARGLELETRDAMDIYTAAQYGYAKNLPIAITNNSKINEMAYNGFEDVDYKEALNKGSVDVCTNNQHFYFDKTAVVNTETVGFNAHTGKNMIRVNASGEIKSTFSANIPANYFPLEFKKDTTKFLYETGGNMIEIPAVMTKMNYWNRPEQESYWAYADGGNRLPSSGPNHSVEMRPETADDEFTGYRYKYSTSGMQWGAGQTPPNEFIFKFNSSSTQNATWTVNNSIGYEYHNLSNYIQLPNDATFLIKKTVRSTGAFSYTFPKLDFEILDDKGDPVPYLYLKTDFKMTPGSLIEEVMYYTVCLKRGRYKINASNYAQQNVQCNTYSCVYTGNFYNELKFEGVTNPVSYKSLTTSGGCIFTRPIAGDESMLNPVFQPSYSYDKKMLLSAWVREQRANPYEKGGYTNGKVRLVFRSIYGGVMGSYDFPASGPVIEGWQKIEGEFSVPSYSATVEVILLNNSSSIPVYFDDIRIHPLSGNMKSYVYDPVNLRLVAELDANNYATFYEYDEEGGLIRTKAETYEGVKTIKETRSANQKTITNIQ